MGKWEKNVTRGKTLNMCTKWENVKDAVRVRKRGDVDKAKSVRKGWFWRAGQCWMLDTVGRRTRIIAKYSRWKNVGKTEKTETWETVVNVERGKNGKYRKKWNVGKAKK